MNIALIIILALGILVILILFKSFKDLNKITCPKCGKEELEQASYNSTGKCSCGYSEEIETLNKRLKEINRYA